MKTLANILSILLYPLFMPFYGVLLLCKDLLRMYPQVDIGDLKVLLIVTVLFTLAMPLSSFYILYKRGRLTDLYMTNPRERTLPYLISICFIALWVWMLYTIGVPIAAVWAAGASVVVLLVVCIINIWWKISSHLAAIGGLTGSVMTWCAGVGYQHTGLFILLFTIALLLMYARLYLNAHTPLQVVAGYLLGLILCALPMFWI